ncbi:MAG: glucuronate isomerase [Clostridiales bacterium]|nr:glucuronate isomerase [Clostridiales bacterium]
MKKFLDEDFLLYSEPARELYHRYAQKMPIYDYHCHLNPIDIAENRRFNNITEIWLSGDHYKWRAMRYCGIDEVYITGSADDKEKFIKWAETMPYCIGNPLYHWTHLELKRYFNIDILLNPDTADEIWEECNRIIRSDRFTPRNLIEKFGVRVLCTADDPVDSLIYHNIIADNTQFGTKVFPSFRLDQVMNIGTKGFLTWISKLMEVTGIRIECIEDLKEALINRLEYFNNFGCKISDHSISNLTYTITNEDEIQDIFRKALGNGEISGVNAEKYKTYILLFLAREYARLDWTMQLRTGVIRNVNTRMHNLLGPDTGFDTIDERGSIYSLSKVLNNLEETDQLPKTILYCLNPKENEALAALIGCFSQEGVSGKVQLGPGWWFNDNIRGMEGQMMALGDNGLLSKFVGMVTDSRSFLSFTRHEYFRRVLCNLLGTWIENGKAPNDMGLMGNMVMDLCWNNAYNYFGLKAD